MWQVTRIRRGSSTQSQVRFRRQIKIGEPCETCFTKTMKTISIRDLRLRWPAAESALATERELIVTRDGKPVAKLVRLEEKTRKRKRFKPEEHKLKMQKLWGDTR